MKIKHEEIIPDKEDPFAKCKLKREPYASVLTDIVKNHKDGFVLAINNEWGTGKTTFVKMWKEQLEDKGFRTIYFNAWENDFDNNPLVAVMSELKTLTDNKEIFIPVLKKSAVLIKNIVPALLKSLIKNYLGEIEISDVIENAAKASTEILEKQIEEYSSKKKTIAEFKEELEKFVKTVKKKNNEQPLIFIIDELDRCRPTYSVEVLEQIKYFFSVPGIVFVLSIDKKHLGSAIKGFYGSENIDSDEYLRRFIDLEYSIPTPEAKLFNEYLFDYYQFKDLFLYKQKIDDRGFSYNAYEYEKLLLRIADILCTTTKTTLRQQERIFALTRLISCSFTQNDYTIFPDLLFILVYWKTMRNDVFQKIERNELTLQDLSDLFFNTIYSEKDYDESILSYLLRTEALLLWFYNNRDSKDREKLVNTDGLMNVTTPIRSKLENAISLKYINTNSYKLSTYFVHFKKNNIYSENLNYLIKKINLTEAIEITS